jgi:aryl-alcohol dehydrogenase-like predicted oxidoreductase
MTSDPSTLAAYAPLGRSGIDVFRLCLGGNVFGWTADEPESFAVLDAYLAAGGNFIDTADIYWKAGNRGVNRKRSSATGLPRAASATSS